MAEEAKTKEETDEVMAIKCACGGVAFGVLMNPKNNKKIKQLACASCLGRISVKGGEVNAGGKS